jgi:hypothetical protein
LGIAVLRSRLPALVIAVATPLLLIDTTNTGEPIDERMRTIFTGITAALTSPGPLMVLLAMSAAAPYTRLGFGIPSTMIAVTAAVLLAAPQVPAIVHDEALLGVALCILGLVFIIGQQLSTTAWLALSMISATALAANIAAEATREATPVTTGFVLTLALTMTACAAAMMTATRAMILTDASATGRIMRAAGGALIAMSIVFLTSVWD